MNPEPPLHVQVALAFGWTEPRRAPGGWRARPPRGHIRYGGYPCKIPPYGEDSPDGWACTGPLLQRFCLDITERTTVPSSWVAEVLSDRGQTLEGRGDTPCEAIARCVVALAAAGAGK